MRFLAGLEHTMERWSTTVWQSLVPRQRKQAEVVGILRRECDDRALILDRRRTLVPNAFVIELPPESHRQLTDDSAQVAGHLAAHIRRHAAEQGYTFAGPVAVHLAPADDAGVGRFRIRSHISPFTDDTTPGNRSRTPAAVSRWDGTEIRLRTGVGDLKWRR